VTTLRADSATLRGYSAREGSAFLKGEIRMDSSPRIPVPAALLCVLLLLSAAIDLRAASDASADDFLQSCAACHSIGEGQLVGPDLLPATRRPAAELRAAVQRMEDNVGPLTPLHDGLGWFPGSFGPHAQQPGRLDGQVECVRAGTLPPGWALDDGAALHFVDGRLERVITASDTARVHTIDIDCAHLVETERV
jgi:hypothetical protein